MIIDYSKQLSTATTYETLSYLHWIRQMAPTEAEKTTRMRAKANKDPRRSWIWLMSDQNEAHQTPQVWSQVLKFTKFLQLYSKHFLGEHSLREAQYSYNGIPNILSLLLYYHILLESKSWIILIQCFPEQFWENLHCKRQSSYVEWLPLLCRCFLNSHKVWKSDRC